MVALFLFTGAGPETFHRRLSKVEANFRFGQGVIK
jgi:hypothetical protein